MHHLTSDEIELVAKEVPCWPTDRKWNSKDKDVRLTSFFGASSDEIADLWNRLCDMGLPKTPFLGSSVSQSLWNQGNQLFHRGMAMHEDFCEVGLAHGEEDFQIER